MLTLTRRIKAETAELFAVKEGRRLLLAECKPELEIYEDTQKISVLGCKTCKVRRSKLLSVVCFKPDITREADADFLQSVSRFEMQADVQRSDGIFERFFFDTIIPTDIDFHGEWRFEVPDSHDTATRLMSI